MLDSAHNDKKILLTGCYGPLIRAFLCYNNLSDYFHEIIATEMKNSLILSSILMEKGRSDM